MIFSNLLIINIEV